MPYSSELPVFLLEAFSSFPVFALDISGKISLWNEACAELTGIPEQDVLHTNGAWKAFYCSPRPCLAELLLSGNEEELQRRYPAVLRSSTSSTASCILQVERVLGGESSIWTQAGILYGASGELTGVYQIFQPVTLPQLKNFSPIIRAFVDKFPLPVVLVLKRKIAAINMDYAQLMGYDDPEKMIGMPIELFLDDSDKEHFLQLNANNHENILSGGTYSWKFRVKGEIRHLEGHPSVFRWGAENALISTVIDITDKMRKEKALENERERLEQENARLLERIARRDEIFFGEGPAMKKVMSLAVQMGKTDTNLVILGETGTGKSLLARMIHDVSPRREQPFIMVNCAAVPESLFESEFFGYVKGAFTGAQTNKQGFLGAAHRGTLFLDEVAELSPAMQAKLLHAIESKKFTPVGGSRPQDGDVRLICATNRNLMRMVEDGTLREDFFYRIFVVDISIPPLRERREDIPRLIEFFLNKFSPMDTAPHISDRLMKRMQDYDWPGNVRELQNIILRYLATGEVLFTFPPRNGTAVSDREGGAAVPDETLAQTLARTERECILRALKRCGGNKIRAAELLGVNLRTFHRRCASLGLVRHLPMPRSRGKSEE